MDEYIARKAAMLLSKPPKEQRHYQTYNLDAAYEQGWDDALCCLERIPSANVKPVRRWTLSRLGCAGSRRAGGAAPRDCI